MLSLSHCVTSTLSRCRWKRRRCYALACGIMHRSMRRSKGCTSLCIRSIPVPCGLWRHRQTALPTASTPPCCARYHRYGKWHGAGKHSVALHRGIVHIPQGGLTPHPQCFSGHDDCKTEAEAWPIEAYRAFYRVDKAAFARWDKGGREDALLDEKENDNEHCT